MFRGNGCNREQQRNCKTCELIFGLLGSYFSPGGLSRERFVTSEGSECVSSDSNSVTWKSRLVVQ